MTLNNRKKIALAIASLCSIFLFGCTAKEVTTSLETESVETEEIIEKEIATEEIATEEIAATKPATLEETIAKTILEYQFNRYSKEGEVYAEGHILLDTKEDGNVITAYLLTMYGNYQFQDGNFVKASGSGGIPAVIRFTKIEDSNYKMIDYKEAADGGLYKESIEELFPKELWERLFTFKIADYDLLKAQELAYAKQYLKSIGRDVAIGEYSDFEHTILSEVGITNEVSNEIDKARKYDGDVIARAPFWLGNVERLDGDTRYIYEQRYEEEKEEILFSKMKYDTKEVVDQIVFDALTGKKKE